MEEWISFEKQCFCFWSVDSERPRDLRLSDLPVALPKETQALVDDFVSFGAKREAALWYAENRNEYITREGSEDCFFRFLDNAIRGEDPATHRQIIGERVEEEVLESLDPKTIEKFGYVIPLRGRFHVHWYGRHLPHLLDPHPDLERDRWHFNVGAGKAAHIYVTGRNPESVVENPSVDPDNDWMDQLKNQVPDAENKTFLFHGTLTVHAFDIETNGLWIDLGEKERDLSTIRAVYFSETCEHALGHAIEKFQRNKKDRGQNLAVVIFAVPTALLEGFEHMVFHAPDEEWKQYTRGCLQWRKDFHKHTYSWIKGPVTANGHRIKESDESPYPRPDNEKQLVIRNEEIEKLFNDNMVAIRYF